jgi:hypothetical protein
VLALLKDYILFAEKDEELQKFILRQHQTRPWSGGGPMPYAQRSPSAARVWSGTPG